MATPTRSRHPQNSLEAIFERSSIRSKSRENSPVGHNAPRHVYASLRKSFRGSGGWPFWKTLRWTTTSEPHRCDFTLQMNNEYRTYAKHHPDPSDLFNRSMILKAEIEDLMTHAHEHDRIMDAYSNFTAESMAHAIFGSNMQERAGLQLDATYKMCMNIFDSGEIDPNDMEERSAEYNDHVRHLIEKGFKDPCMEDVIRSRREVIQHAQAMKHIFDAALNRDDPLSEEVILETHRILCHDIPRKEGEIEKYAGRYRAENVVAGSTMFVEWQQVPRQMQIFVDGFNEDVRGKEIGDPLDPFYLAADACQDFVTIHPVLDGNGRMCRLIMNAFLIKYAGVVAAIGEHDEERKDYLAIAEQAGDNDTEDEAKGKLSTLILEKGLANMEALRRALRKAGEEQ